MRRQTSNGAGNGPRTADRLRPRERAVLQLCAEGLSIAEIAEQLDLPLEGAREALQGAIAALGAASKLEAIIAAARLGLIRLDE